MQVKSFRFTSNDGSQIFVRQWLPDADLFRAALLIAHGAAEHGARYKRLASVLVAQGYVVYAPDHRGHGQTAGALERVGHAGPDGFNGMIRDLRQRADSLRGQYPRKPLFLLGHSMGAALSQRFIQFHGDILSGVILSGSPGLRPNLEQAAQATAKAAEGAAAEEISTLFQQAFASYNQGFEPRKTDTTGFEWLSRDAMEVKKYIDDPWCGFPFTNRLVAEMAQCALDAARDENIARIPTSLPILFLSGACDRVGGNGEYVEKLVARYRAAGIVDIESILYPEGRHEMFNETNRDEVHRDLLKWLNKHAP